MPDVSQPDIYNSRTIIVDRSRNHGAFRQYYTSFVISLLCISKGLTNAWSSPMMQILQSDDSPVGKMDSSQISTLQSIQQLAGIGGVALAVVTLFKYGTKISALVQAAVGAIGWVVLLSATNTPILYAGRFLTGLTNIGVDVVSSFFLSEIASDVRRGAVIAYGMFGSNVGTLIGFGLGVAVTNYRIFNGLCIIPPAIFFVLFYWIPETPPHLIRIDQADKALESYMWFQGVSPEAAQVYVHKMMGFSRRKLNIKAIFQEKSNKRALLIMAFLIAFTQLCGTTVIGSYTSKIFELSECSLTPNQSSLLVAIITFGAALLAALLIDRAGRRFLVIVSLLLMSLAMYDVTFYFAAKEEKWVNFRSYEWMIYVGVGSFQGASTVLGSTASQAIGSELVPSGVKGMLWLFAGLASLVLSIMTIQLYEFITSHGPYYVNFLQNAVFCTFSVIIAWFIVLETKGKSLAQITAELNGEAYYPDMENRQSRESLSEASDDIPRV